MVSGQMPNVNVSPTSTRAIRRYLIRSGSFILFSFVLYAATAGCESGDWTGDFDGFDHRQLRRNRKRLTRLRSHLR